MMNLFLKDEIEAILINATFTYDKTGPFNVKIRVLYRLFFGP